MKASTDGKPAATQKDPLDLRSCTTCQRIYRPKLKRQRFCSDECRADYWRGVRERGLAQIDPTRGPMA